jgi:hypothetical protein
VYHLAVARRRTRSYIVSSFENDNLAAGSRELSRDRKPDHACAHDHAFNPVHSQSGLFSDRPA